jgi:hypothetical protein
MSADREIMDSRAIGKIGWSVIKILLLFLGFLLLTRCVSHAQLPVVSQQAYNGYYGYYDGFKVQPAAATITIATSWVNMDVQCSYAGGAQVDLGVMMNGQTFTDTSSMGPNVPPGAPYTDTYYAYVSGTLESTYSITFSESGAVQNTTAGVYPWTGPNLVTGIWGCGGPPDTGNLQINATFANAGSGAHSFALFIAGVQVDSGTVPPTQDVAETVDPTEEPGSYPWYITVDGAIWQSGNANVFTGQTTIVNAGTDTFSASSPTPSPSRSPSPAPSATPSPTPDSGPSPTPSGSPSSSATPAPSASPTPDGGGGAGATPTPSGSGDGASPTPGTTGTDSGLTEGQMEQAIENTFGNTTGAPQASSNDFQPSGTYTPPPDNTTAGLQSARDNLDGNVSMFQAMVPDLSGFQSIGTQYTFSIDCSGLGLGMATIDLSPYATAIGIVRGLCEAMIGLVLIIKFIKHLGPTL